MTSKLSIQKKELKEKLEHLAGLYNTGMVGKEEYLEKRFELLKGRFEKDVFEEMDEKISKSGNKTKINVLSSIIVIASLVMIGTLTNVTFFAIFEGDDTATLPINEAYPENTTKDLSFIKTSSYVVPVK